VRDIAMPATPNASGAPPTAAPEEETHTCTTFDYQRPPTAAAAWPPSGDTRYLAGGQSLVQAMKLRLSQSERLVDLGGVAELKASAGMGKATSCAMTRHADVAASADVQERPSRRWPNWPAASATAMVRNMGTSGGSVANADPAACYPAAVLGLGATVHTNRSAASPRTASSRACSRRRCKPAN
jgi:carbon-monoxide dehydrogenase medium subunit